MKSASHHVPSVILLLLLGMVSHASAHTGHAVEGGFPTGFMHPLMGLDHMAAMLAVGIWGAVIGGRALWSLPIVFPVAMLLGAWFGMNGVAFPAVETWIATSALILGLAVAFLVRPPLWVAATLVGFFAVFHGHAHGAELPAGAGAAGYVAGFAAATALLHVSGIGVGLAAKLPHGPLAVRMAGGAVAVFGAALLIGWL